MANTWYLWQSGPNAAADNMALDEAVLTALPRLGRPLLRFYGWTESAATFGYSQSHALASVLTPLRPLIRRPTGGGLVSHAGDWTYSLFFPPHDPWYSTPAVTGYQRLHQWLRGAFARLDLETTLAGESRRPASGQCFSGPERFDLVREGVKLAGAAQRRTRTGLLIQGSIQPPPPAMTKAEWQKAMCDEAHFGLGVDWVPFEPDTALREHAALLANEKYSTRRYNERR
jgi:lipoyl(octanoyl) transferase